ncbi:MAG: efflux RND transporter periplasmic adaptor subunit [SAR324 cluster bacterium]|nr:efflux RND transporter periplasmic adaptor subunit [SAR324 cluster bacterium]
MPFMPGHIYRVPIAAAVFCAMLSPAEAQDKQKPAGPPPAPVVVAPVRLVMEAPRSTYSGFLEPVEIAQLSAIEPGFVKTIFKRAGARVKRGEVLCVLTNPSMLLDLDVLEAQLKESEALLAQAELRLDRMRTLYDSELVAAEQFENEEAGVRVFEARLTTTRAMRDRLRGRLKMLVVRSPISGQIVSSDLDLGQWITPNGEIYRIANFARIELQIGVPGKFVHTVPEGAAVEVFVPEIERTLKGRIRAVVQHVEADSGNFTVRIDVSNPKRLPLSGLLAHATVPLGKRKQVKVVPRDAIVRRGNSTQVVVVRDNVAQIVPVTIDGAIADAVIVTADLEPKEPVVVRGNERLFPGMRVNVTETQ